MFLTINQAYLQITRLIIPGKNIAQLSLSLVSSSLLYNLFLSDIFIQEFFKRENIDPRRYGDNDIVFLSRTFNIF